MRLLVFGKTGQVAQELARVTAAHSINATFLGRDQADLTDPAACAAIVAQCSADAVVNAAALTAVDKAETDAATAQVVNADAPIAMARAAAARGIPFLHISTDYVFDGSGTRPWAEQDTTAPQGVYGATKLAGERGVMAAGGTPVILRTAWVFSAFGANFVKTMRRLGADRDTLNVVDDQRGGPTPAADIAAALIAMATILTKGRGQPGIYHFSGQPAVSWADFATAIFASDPNAPTINRILTRDYPTPAKRPANSVLECRKIETVFGLKQPDWRAGLSKVLQELEQAT